MANCEPIVNDASLSIAMSSVRNICPLAMVVTVGNSTSNIPTEITIKADDKG